MVGFRLVMWIVVLKSAKDWVLGVNTSGQQALPHVWYRMACLLIRGTVGSVPYSDEWELV
jgi:hypothetical protein